MQAIKLSKLEIRNVKGVEHLEWNLETTPLLQMENGKGKTTALQSIAHMLWGKGLYNDTVPLESNTIIGDLFISLTIVVDGKTIELKKDEKTLWFDGAKCKTIKEYQGKVAALTPVPLELLMNPEYILNLEAKVARKFVLETSGFNTEALDKEVVKEFGKDIYDIACAQNLSTSTCNSTMNSLEKEKAKLEGIMEGLGFGNLIEKLSEAQKNLAIMEPMVQAYFVAKEKYDDSVAHMQKYFDDKKGYEIWLTEAKENLRRMASGVCQHCGNKVNVSEGAYENLKNEYQVKLAEYKALVAPEFIEQPLALVSSEDYNNAKAAVILTKKTIDDSAKYTKELANKKHEIATLTKVKSLCIFREIKFVAYAQESIKLLFPSKSIEVQLTKKSLEGIESPTFDLLIDGISVHRVNSAKTLMTKVFITRCLQKHFQVSTPILADNLELLDSNNLAKYSPIMIGTRVNG